MKKSWREDYWELLAEIRTATNGNYVLGTARVQEEISRMLGRRVTKGGAGRPSKGTEEEG